MPDLRPTERAFQRDHAVLMKNQLRRIDLICCIECQDCVDIGEKESVVHFREDFKPFLRGCLGE